MARVARYRPQRVVGVIAIEHELLEVDTGLASGTFTGIGHAALLIGTQNTQLASR